MLAVLLATECYGSPEIRGKAMAENTPKTPVAFDPEALLAIQRRTVEVRRLALPARERSDRRPHLCGWGEERWRHR
jgi:hypothetical protein